MAKLTEYQIAKANLKGYAKGLKENSLPKTTFRCYLNDYCDKLERELTRDFDKLRLQNYCCKLHPKD